MPAMTRPANTTTTTAAATVAGRRLGSRLRARLTFFDVSPYSCHLRLSERGSNLVHLYEMTPGYCDPASQYSSLLLPSGMNWRVGRPDGAGRGRGLLHTLR